MITRNSADQPSARLIAHGGGFAVQLEIPSAVTKRDRILVLSPAKAEELAIELEHAAKVARGEA